MTAQKKAEILRLHAVVRERDRDDAQVIAALRAARSFLTQPTLVTHQGSLCRAEYLMTSSTYNELNAQICAAIKQMGELP
jgi:hypothetical protein